MMIRKKYDRISNKSMRLRKDFLIYSGLYKLFTSKFPVVLAYHGVAPKMKSSINHRHISPDVFEKHLIFLKRNCHVISIEDFFNKKFISGKKNIAITFDDGYKNNLKYALPLLQKYNLPATIYVTGINLTNESILWPDLHDLVAFKTTDFLDYDGLRFYKKGNFYRPLITNSGINLADYLKVKSFEEKMILLSYSNEVQRIIRNKELSDYWETLSNEEIRIIDNSKLVKIGSHGFFHNNFANIVTEDAEKEIINSKKYIENIINKEVTSIAYPDGSYTREVIDVAFKHGFNQQLAVRYLHIEDSIDDRIINRRDLYEYETLSMQKLTMVK